MATFTFDRPIAIRGEESRKRLENFINSNEYTRKLPGRAFSEAERKKVEELLARYYFHSDR